MVKKLQVTCINKTNRTSPYERISHIGASAWKHTTDECIKNIESGTVQYYVSIGGKEAMVIVATSAQGHKYLKTEADGEQPNNLLSLPECNASTTLAASLLGS